MKELMQGLRDSSIKAILEADDIELLESLRVKYLGKKGELTGILRQMFIFHILCLRSASPLRYIASPHQSTAR